MNLETLKSFFSNLTTADLPAGGAGLAGIVLLALACRAGKFLYRTLFVVVALGLFAGAWWWHQHR